MLRRTLFLLLLLGAAEPAWTAGQNRSGIYDPLHGYFTREPEDRFRRLQRELEAGRVTLDSSGELAFLISLLRALEIPVSSQMLVYSVTSLQKALISPRRPRALYFNDDTYLGYVPGGRVEIIGTDPMLGSIFYIYDPMRGAEVPVVERSSECMNCHAPAALGNVPALALESVVPGLTGGGEKAFRREQSGHGVPLELRFGGWHLTGAPEDWPGWSNRYIDYRQGQAVEHVILPGDLFALGRYPRPTSDLLPQLLQEHQVGFVNRALQAAYRTRELLDRASPGEAVPEISRLAHGLVRYLLFADEVPLPSAVTGDDEFRAAFLANRLPSSSGLALKDFDLQTRLFRHRCSYMIYTPTFKGLPLPLKNAVFAQLAIALNENEDTAPEFTYLPRAEKQTIRSILAETVPGFVSAGDEEATNHANQNE